MWWVIRSSVWYVVLIVLAVACTVWIPRLLARVRVPNEFQDLNGIEPFTLQWIDSTSPCRPGDLIAFRCGRDDDRISFAHVAAVAGDELRVDGDGLKVAGRPSSAWAPKNSRFPLVGLGPVTVPAGHVFVVSSGHRFDSLARGPIPLGLVLGRIRE